MGAPLRIATFNVRCGNANDGLDAWSHRRPRTIAFLRELAPDVVGLQEAIDVQMDDLRFAFPAWEAIGVGREDGVRDGEHAAIFFDWARLRCLESGNFWFSDTPEVPGSMHWGNRICRICTWGHFEDLTGGPSFWHFNLHVDHESGPSRDRSAVLLLEKVQALPSGARVVVTGDFNEDEQAPGILRMKAGGFRDSYRVVHPDVEFVGTFSGFRDSYNPEKIDYIFVDPGAEVLEAEIVRTKVDSRWPSDHAAVTATVRF